MTAVKLPTRDRTSITTLEKMTVNYIAAQDRLRLVGQRRNGEPLVLWLTQRLCNQMVVTLTGALEKMAEARGALVKDAMLSFQQSAARARLASPSLPAAAAGPQAAQVLVRGVEVRRNDKRFVLTFRFGKDSGAAMAFGVSGVHQWLSILHGRYRKAAWPLESWPEWFEGSGPKSAANATVLH